jgi:hypothetical protein
MTVYKLAGMIMSDCGHSTNNQRLLDRIADRIQRHIDANTPPAAQPAPVRETEQEPVAELLKQSRKNFDHNFGKAGQGWADWIYADLLELLTTPPAAQPADHIGDANKMVQPAAPDWWPAVENILNEYGLQAIDFVADFKAAQPAQEPVAEVIALTKLENESTELTPRIIALTLDLRVGDKLYTTPPAQLAPVPLTEEQIGKMYRTSQLGGAYIVLRSDYERGIRDCETAHGIGEIK